MTEKINIIILVMQNCCSSHVYKRFYQTDFKFIAEIYEDGFNAFSLKAKVRLLAELVEG